MDYEFKDHLIENGILSQLTAPGTPQQNGVAERRNRTFLDMMRSMLSYSSLPNSFWGYALQTSLADEISPIPTRVVEQEREKTNTQDPTPPPPPRRSEREIRLPIRYREEGEAQVAVTDGGDDDPLTYKMAIIDVDQEKWQEAMKLEMESMYSNLVWKLVGQPEGVKPIGCKWIYKKKRGPDGKFETFKARLVAKGFT
ncbi:uncharacterized protein [Henckelia pumila]|uniref:uncharacterized protein n=1 Tax=Henckelia pumila TaxID=405737 RepID=UPI003C6DE662